jgi:5-methylcytosine-specific restriction enzyme A
MPIVDFSAQAEARAFYDSPAWRELRARHIRRNPNCAQCGQRFRRGMTVDHKQPRRTVPALALDPANLQTLCRWCHDSTKRHIEADDRHPLGGGVGADGYPLADRHPWRSGARGPVAPDSGPPEGQQATAGDRPPLGSRFAYMGRFARFKRHT